MRKAYLELHLAVLLFGFTAILGKVISIPTISLVWWRVLITSISLLFLVGLIRTLRELPVKRIAQYMGIGCLVALHWIAFFGSIKASNASVALVALATTSFFTSLIEPLLLKQKIVGLEILLGLLIVPAMILVAHGIDPKMHTGIWLGLASAFLASVFASLNKKLITYAKPIQITFFEITSACICISIVLLTVHFTAPSMSDFHLQMPVGIDWLYLGVLALICTTLAYVLAVKALHHLSAFAANLVVNLEPVYGILLAWLLLKENQELSVGFYLGVAMIVGVVFLHPFLKWRKGGRAEGKKA